MLPPFVLPTEQIHNGTWTDLQVYIVALITLLPEHHWDTSVLQCKSICVTDYTILRLFWLPSKDDYKYPLFALFLLSPAIFHIFPQNRSVFLDKIVDIRCQVSAARVECRGFPFLQFNNRILDSSADRMGISYTMSRDHANASFRASEMFNNSMWRCFICCSQSCNNISTYICSTTALVKIQGKMFLTANTPSAKIAPNGTSICMIWCKKLKFLAYQWSHLCTYTAAHWLVTVNWLLGFQNKNVT